MRKLFCVLSLCLLGVTGLSQPLSLFSYEGEVHLKSPSGIERTKKLNMPVDLNDVVTIAPGSSLSIFEEKQSVVLVFGECTDRTLESLLKNRKNHFWGRVLSAIEGADASERAYVSYKGENPLPEFLFAAHQESYDSVYRLELQVIDDATGKEVRYTMSDGQQVHFRVVNREDFPLCIGILWQDSKGDVTICHEGAGRYCLVPANGVLDLVHDPMIVGPPFGKDRIFLFAAQELFDLQEYPEMSAAYRPGERPGIPIGFVRKDFRIQ